MPDMPVKNPFDGNFVLTDSQIVRLAAESATIDPFDPGMLSGCSYDLRVGPVVRSRNRGRTYDLRKTDYYIESGECITFESLEAVDFGNPLLFGYIVNKHSVLAKGLVHPITKIDPGFKGPLAITIFNLGSIAEPIRYEQPLVSLVIMPVLTHPERVYGASQIPSYRQGSLDPASITNEPAEPLDDRGLARMYGRPIARLYEIVATLETSIENGLILQRREEKKRQADLSSRFTQAIVVAIFSSTLTLLGRYLIDRWSAPPLVAPVTTGPAAAPKMPAGGAGKSPPVPTAPTPQVP